MKVFYLWSQSAFKWCIGVGKALLFCTTVSFDENRGLSSVPVPALSHPPPGAFSSWLAPLPQPCVSPWGAFSGVSTSQPTGAQAGGAGCGI